MAKLTKWSDSDGAIYLGDGWGNVFVYALEDGDISIGADMVGDSVMKADEAITALEEAIDWIREHANEATTEATRPSPKG